MQSKGEYDHGCLDCHGSVQSEKLFWLRKENAKLKEALREAVEHMDCCCGTEYSCSMCRFREKHAAIIAEIINGEEC